MVTVARTENLTSLLDEAAAAFIDLVRDVQSDGTASARVVLTGGGAGIGLLEKIRERAEEIDWSRIHVFFGDERNVPLDHEDSNERQAREALLDHVDIPADHIHGYGLGSVDMAEAATAYEQTVRDVAPDGFDLHLLGMGHEGHINSLFPHTPAVRETERLVLSVDDSPKPPPERVTLTLPAVARARRVWLLVSGADKAEATAQIVARANPEDWPAAGAEGSEETVLYVTDDAATRL